MKIETTLTKTKSRMQVRVSEDVLRKIDDWRKVMDEEMYHYQIATGFIVMGSKDKLPTEVLTRIKSRAEENGFKRPYTGASGGAVSYRFSMTKDGSVLEVYNSMNKKTLTIKNEPVQTTDQQKLKLVKLWDILPKEMKRLNEWKLTVEGQGYDSDYIYDFAGTSLGSSIKVMNKRTGAEIDLTDYDSW